MRNKTKMSPISAFIQHKLIVPVTAIKQSKEIKGIQTAREEEKLSLFSDDVLLNIED